ncbi:cell division protein ZapA [Variovorax soli]|uniref:cell division protein ZapA n=1 Tax=Variovorax soli TaxID=376815 RepID=UPI0008385630|nr:cell division protein ZapA [Variovorax soli]
MKHIDVQIMGQSYLLGCPEGGEPQLRDAVERVDAAMTKIRESGKVKARDRIAVLAALNLAFDLAQLQKAKAEPASAQAGDAAAAAAAAAASAQPQEAADPRLAQLVQRLDQVLAGDGLLI